MKLIPNIINNIKNLIPYLLLIAIYFFFVNLEARKDINDTENYKKGKITSDDNLDNNDKELRITIPVIPYDQ